MNARHEAIGPDYDRPDSGSSSRESVDRGPGDGAEPARVDGREDRRTVVGREKEKYGGVKIGSAFFGWLTATGAAVLLIALVSAVGVAIGANTGLSPDEAAGAAAQDAATAGIVGAIVLAVILFIAYYCGGYVAGRMARFNGMKQGIAVWIWAVVIAIIVAVAGAVAGNQFNIVANMNAFPRIPMGTDQMTLSAVITLLVILAVTLAGAILGGLAGMRFHRNVDKEGLGR
ncbi:hypothetical protein [Arthrobacter crystallopoietes]|uniref:Uncharacterized protein n=1 Tax=Crystallibacter crystallopoietes TaxID=37928 RepID=A0A1H1E4U2_9MICC|nr:hypothetical protein [Arthrobacter crystallopoietes]AUI50048.1 hypothetical protein AC20117_03675 [Arthrobacter crystallopoietes]SDQ83499.1 hypothetical protein SAMN04489742_2754 [Arthrobacter crystallopoietes]